MEQDGSHPAAEPEFERGSFDRRIYHVSRWLMDRAEHPAFRTGYHLKLRGRVLTPVLAVGIGLNGDVVVSEMGYTVATWLAKACDALDLPWRFDPGDNSVPEGT